MSATDHDLDADHDPRLRRGRDRTPRCATSPCRAARHARAHHAGQRLRPHQAQHLRPADPRRRSRRRSTRLRPRAEAGEIVRPSASPASRSSSPSAPTSRPCRRRRDREQALERRPRRPRGVRARSWTCRCRRSRSSTVPRWAAASRSRCTATYRTISAGVPGARAARDLPRPGPRLGRLLPAAQPRSASTNALKVIIENPLNMNRMLKGPQAFELGIADAMFEPADFLEESLRWAAAVLAGRDHGRARHRGRRATRPSGTAAVKARQGPGRPQDRRHGPGAVPRPRARRGGPHRRPATRPSPPRTRRSPTWSWATSCAPGSTPSTSCSGGPSARPARPTRPWPARSPRSASSAPA